MFRKPKRMPRKVGREDDDDEPPIEHNASTATGSPVVIKRSTKPKVAKVKSHLPNSHNSESSRHSSRSALKDDDPFAAVERKRTAVFAQKSRLSSSNLPYRSQSNGDEADAPRYTTDYLATLRAEQTTAPPPEAQIVSEDDLPPTPPNASAQDIDLGGLAFIDTGPSYGAATVVVSNPAGSSALIREGQQSYIPSATEIAEKKARRARLAAEGRAEDLIKLDESDAASSDDERNANDSLILKAEERTHKDKYGRDESRLGQFQLDDDDFAEGFDEFVDDPGKLATSVDGRKQARQKRREDIQKHLAENADEGAEEDVDLDEVARTRAYENAQIRNATYGHRTTEHGREHRQKEQDREREEKWRRQCEMRYIVRPVPRTADVVRRIKEKMEEAAKERERLEKQMEAVRREREEIAGEEVRVQALLKEAGERLERVLRSEGERTDPERGAKDGNGGGKRADTGEKPMEIEDEPAIVRKSDAGGESEEADEEAASTDLWTGLGAGIGTRVGLGAGLGASSGMAGRAVDTDEEDEGEASFRPGLGAKAGLSAL